MGMFTSFDINASGMTAERYRMDIILKTWQMRIPLYGRWYTTAERLLCLKRKGPDTIPSGSEQQRHSGNGVKVTGVVR